jgi:multiple sugar transport system substrate-binding protein
MKRTLVVVAALMVAAVTLGFAAGGNEGAGSATKVSLEYWIAGDVNRTPVYQKSVDLFVAKYPNIAVTVNEEVGNNQQIQQKLLTMIAAGTSPNVIQTDTIYVEDMARAGTIVPLSDLKGSKELAEVIYKGAMDPMYVNGKIYGYPIRANSIQILHNKRMYKEAGLDPEKPPRLLSQVIEHAPKLTRRDNAGNVQVFGYETGITKDPHWTIHVLSPILWTYGGAYLTADGKAGFGGDAALKSIAFWNKLINELKVSPTDRIASGFATEKLAMEITGEWSIKPYRAFPNLDYGFSTLPVAADGVKPLIPLGGRANVVPKGAKNLNESWALIQWVMTKEEQMRYTIAEVGLTPRRDLASDPWFSSNPKYKQALEDMQYVKAKAAPEILQMNTIFADAVQKAVLLGEPADKSLKEAVDKYNQVLATIKK